MPWVGGGATKLLTNGRYFLILLRRGIVFPWNGVDFIPILSPLKSLFTFLVVWGFTYDEGIDNSLVIPAK
jgi:hypothetical protein